MRLRSRLAAFLAAALLLAAGAAQADTLAELKARFEREKGKDFQTRYATLNEIAAVGTVEALRLLEKIAKDDTDASIRSNALFCVARVPVPEAGDVLLRFYREGDPNHRSSILSAWTSYRPEPLPDAIVTEALAGKDVSTRTSIVGYLGRRADPRFLPEARRFLAEFPQSATSLTSNLTQNPSPEAARLLLEFYDDTRSYDRDTVPKFFAGAEPPVRAVLVEAIRAGRDPTLLRAAQIAARAKVAEAEEALVAAARAAKEDDRRATFLEDAGRVGLATDAGKALALEWLRYPKEIVVVAAVRALRNRQVAEAVPALIDLVGGKGEVLRAEARITLERTTGQQFGDRADLWEAWWREYGPTFDPSKVRAPDEDQLDQTLVNLAIDKGAAALRAAATKDPKEVRAPWEYAGHPVGTTALVLLALQAAGTDPKDHAFAAGLRWLLQQPVPNYTYDAGLVAMALETIGGRRHHAKIAEAAKVILAGQNESGFWGYPTGKGDHSNTQYAVLGLRHAARAGVAVPQKAWKAARDHWLATQDDDGGWSYVPQSSKDVSSASMTAAGLSSLLICLENAENDDTKRQDMLAAIDRGFTALGTIAKLDKDTLYTLYGIERAGMLGNRSRMGTVPWYVPGAKRLLDEQGRDGFWTGQYHRAVDSAFAVLFLKKATAPIAASTR